VDGGGEPRLTLLQEILHKVDTPRGDVPFDLSFGNRHPRNSLCCCIWAGVDISFHIWMLSDCPIHVAW